MTKARFNKQVKCINVAINVHNLVKYWGLAAPLFKGTCCVDVIDMPLLGNQ